MNTLNNHTPSSSAAISAISSIKPPESIRNQSAKQEFFINTSNTSPKDASSNMLSNTNQSHRHMLSQKEIKPPNPNDINFLNLMDEEIRLTEENVKQIDERYEHVKS